MCVSRIRLNATVIDRFEDLSFKVQAETYREMNKQIKLNDRKGEKGVDLHLKCRHNHHDINLMH